MRYRRGICLLLAYAALFGAIINWGSSSPALARAAGLARLEPPSGTYFGVNLDWSQDTPAAYNRRLGQLAAVYVRFFRFPFQSDDLRQLEEFISLVSGQGGIAMLTLEPVEGLQVITPDVADNLAIRLAAFNAAGVPIFVRFGHEMNGSWYPWSQQPSAYRSAFQLVAQAVHTRVPQAAMVWAPNYGAGYPFTGGTYEAKPGTQAFDELDTNDDGVLTTKDDMYLPYYPGDSAVDWVGMSLYHWGSTYPWGENEIPEAGKFIAQIRGTYNGLNGDERDLPDFYDTYVIMHEKPMAIPETAALFNTTLGSSDDLRMLIKRTWWRQIFDPQVSQSLPRLKMINWFEWRKNESEIGGALIDWSVTFDPTLAQSFVSEIPDTFVFGPIRPDYIRISMPLLLR